MQLPQLYILSKEEELATLLPVVLSKMKIEVQSRQSTKGILTLCKKTLPNVLLIDDKTVSEKQIQKFLKEYLTCFKQSIASVILVSNIAHTRDRVNYMTNGVNNFINRPVDIMEMVALISGIIQYQRRLQKIISYERNITIIDTMENLSEYLTNHIAEPIQRFVNDDMTDAKVEKLQKYIRFVRKGAAEVMAAINAVRDEVNTLVSHHTPIKDPTQDLDELYKKNLTMITAAYGLDKNLEEPKEKSV